MVKFTEEGWRGGGNGELVFNGSRVSVWEDKNILEMDSGDGSMIMLGIFNATKRHT